MGTSSHPPLLIQALKRLEYRGYDSCGLAILSGSLSVHLVPAVAPPFSPVDNVVVMQLLAYYAARARDCPIDMPRNLAKSVTVK